MASGVIQYESQKHDLGEPTTLTLNTPYTIPTDGYLHISGPYLPSSSMESSFTRCYINDIMLITVNYSISGTTPSQAVLVNKDMVVTVTHLPDSGTGGGVRFYPLI